jgi:uridine kinase
MLDGIVEQICHLGDPFVRVAIDGVDGAGKTVLADEVADRLGRLGRSTVRASVDGFHNPRAVRYARGRDSPAGYYLDSYNMAALESELLRPLGPGGTGDHRRHVFDLARDAADLAPVERAAPGTVLVLDGIFLHRPELARWWTWSLWLEVDVEVSVARCAERDGTSADPASPANRRYVEGQRLYLSEVRPRELASCLVDNNDLAHPVVLVNRG